MVLHGNFLHFLLICSKLNKVFVLLGMVKALQDSTEIFGNSGTTALGHKYK